MSQSGKWTPELKSAIKSFRESRSALYFVGELTCSVQNYWSTVRAYWVIGIACNLVSTCLIIASIIATLSENAAVSVVLTRIDGTTVSEAQDVRREVLIKNALARARLQQESTQDKK